MIKFATWLVPASEELNHLAEINIITIITDYISNVLNHAAVLEGISLANMNHSSLNHCEFLDDLLPSENSSRHVKMSKLLSLHSLLTSSDQHDLPAELENIFYDIILAMIDAAGTDSCFFKKQIPDDIRSRMKKVFEDYYTTGTDNSGFTASSDPDYLHHLIESAIDSFEYPNESWINVYFSFE